jgi:AcrR family transcriptional regulator
VRINPEKKEDRERVAHSLLRVTLQLANAHGFVSLGLREVSRAAEIAPTSFYRHFADMEELGRELIESLAGPFLEQWVEPVGTPPGAERAVSAIALEAVASAVQDPELMRFILAEERGAIPAFRAALASKLAVVSAAVRRAIAVEMPKSGSSPEPVADAVVILMLGACAEVLDQGPEHSAALSERLVAQIRWMLSGAGVKGNP